MKNYVEIRMYIPDETLRYMTIENLLRIDYEGVEEDGNFIIAYCEEERYSEETLKLMLDFPNETFTKQIVPEQNWNALWESSFEPVVVDDFAAVRADFHAPITTVKYEIIITPKMSFGTGHHATTHMMMQRMRSINFTEKTVFDFGTGTGILAILAEKMGASQVLAIDNDEWSIANAKENIERNDCTKILLQQTGNAAVRQQFDVVFANINKNIIIENFRNIVETMKEKSFLILSGLLDTDEQDILALSRSFGLKHNTTQHEKQWISMMFQR